MKESLDVRVRAGIGGMRYGSVPVGKVIGEIELAGDGQTRESFAKMRERLECGGVVVLMSHHGNLDSFSHVSLLGLDNLGKVHIPVAFKWWVKPRFQRAMEWMGGVPELEVYPVVRQKDARLLDEGRIKLGEDEWERLGSEVRLMAN